MDEQWLNKVHAFRQASKRFLALGIIGLMLTGIYAYSEMGVLHGNYGICGTFGCLLGICIMIIFSRSLSGALRTLSVCFLLLGTIGLIFWIRTDFILIHPVAAIMFIFFSPFPYVMGLKAKRDLEDTNLLKVN